MKDKTISFKIEHGMKAKLLVLAKAESRSLSNFIDKVLLEEIHKHEAQHGRIKISLSEITEGVLIFRDGGAAGWRRAAPNDRLFCPIAAFHRIRRQDSVAVCAGEDDARNPGVSARSVCVPGCIRGLCLRSSTTK